MLIFMPELMIQIIYKINKVGLMNQAPTKENQSPTSHIVGLINQDPTKNTG
jgi:hypothetical protein